MGLLVGISDGESLGKSDSQSASLPPSGAGESESGGELPGKGSQSSSSLHSTGGSVTSTGDSVGFEVGCNVVGMSVGVTGARVGSMVGSRVVGISVGVTGASVGPTVGASVEGASVGDTGASVGCTGALLGDCDGISDGKSDHISSWNTVGLGVVATGVSSVVGSSVETTVSSVGANVGSSQIFAKGEWGAGADGEDGALSRPRDNDRSCHRSESSLLCRMLDSDTAATITI